MLWPRVVRRDLQRRQAGQLLPPVVKMGVEGRLSRRQPLPLPHREVAVLDWQFGQETGPAADPRLVDLEQLVKQYPDGPAIEGDVMHRDLENMRSRRLAPVKRAGLPAVCCGHCQRLAAMD